MAKTQDLHQVPPGAEVWEVEGQLFLVWYAPHTDPPVPLAWKVSGDDAEALGINRSRIARRFSSFDDFYRTGALRHGDSRELANTEEHPFDQIRSNYATESKVKPWLRDAEVMSIWAAAALEGRGITDSELQGTEWWRTHTEAERQWMSLNASDPATADRLIEDNRTQVADLMRQAGIDNAAGSLVNLIADNWTTGAWSEVYATTQIRLLADPHMKGELDKALRGARSGLDTTRDREDVVKGMIQQWLGPAYGDKWSQDQIERWASRLRNNPDAELELEEALKRHRKALFPDYEENLTYEDIAAPWRGLVQQVWGQTADETDELFTKILRVNDLATAERMLRQEGMKQGIGNVVNDALSAVDSAFGGGVRRADPAIQ